MSFVENFTNDLNKSINTTINIGKKTINTTIESVGSGIEKSINSTAKSLDNNGSLIRTVDNSIDNLNKTVSNTLITPTIKTVDSSVDNFYKTMFNTLIKPFDKTARMTSKDYNLFRIIGMSIILVIGYISGLLYDNTIGLILNKLGLDKRKRVSKKKNTKLSVLMKILKTILGVITGILDIILLAFTNQTAVLTTIVNDLLKNK
jgi:predicted PurR-regulated permease PerM